MFVGIGIDIHPWADGRKLILGGVNIPYSRGLAGHSDADVLTHSICDAILGAMAEGDIGKHFPDTDPQYKEISSLKLLQQVVNLMHLNGYRLINVDVSIVCEEPRLSPWFSQIKNNLQAILGLQTPVNIKATRAEGLGFIGRKEGILSLAIVLLERYAEG
ncbi:MAG: 2-C-methyl-D-erythritol 2,4-cyclodiphosphate synthase [Candidatus Sumerlaeia bacterium]|nr:2-C-methyl-D-erythritol 2,4-cyclodiphosphate synthase [Candidatus Sumerlaeia bacterium]